MHPNPFTILEEARKSRKEYNSHATREALTNAVKLAFNQNTPRDFQLDMAEALILGLDATVVAGMGSGKTLPWAMPLLLGEYSSHSCIVISPLKALQADHAKFFSALGLAATAVNSDTWNDPVVKRNVIESKYRILLVSPEMCFRSPEFSELLRNPTWAKQFMYVVIDECHCVTQWGKTFRTTYSSTDKLRSFVAPSIPFLITSATLPPASFTEICQLLEISTSSAFHLNLGNDRSNLMPILWPMKGAAKDLNSLNFIVSGKGDLPRVVVYVNKKDLARIGCEHLRAKVAPDQRDQIDFLHASRSKWPQKRILELFQKGDINILFATEVVGMGTDLKNVTLVVQFMVPDTLSVWMQRAGRAGRSGSPSAAVLLYEPSVIQKVKGKLADESDGEDEDGGDLEERLHEGDDFRKKNVESSLRSYVLTEQCRRVVTDAYFGTP
ncbi:P-loop containing nucleoside triphosphate hydrolase protein, partial [Thelephora terrestris]